MSDDRTGQARVGQLLGGKYRLEALLARGGMGLVYAARHEGTGRNVAVKLLRSELVTREDLVRRVSAEARLAVEAAHPNVVEVLDAGADEEGIPYLVLERLHGRTLEAVLPGPLPLLPALQALVPVMNALVALHRAGIVHRDIKPSNLYLSWGADARITPKLLDFGIAKALQGTGATLSGMALGTPAYMAPEQVLGVGAVRPAADVWAMGVVFVRCLTGQLPFERGVGERTGLLGGGLGPEALPGVPVAVAAVLQRALRVEPVERFADMAAFRGELFAALVSLDASAPWPSEVSVGYAGGESELGTLLGGALESETASAASLRGRAEHAVTRTLSRASPLPPPRRRPRLALAALGLVGAVLTALVLQESAGSGAASEAARLQPQALPGLAERHARELALLQAGAEEAMAVAGPEAQVLSAGSQGLRPVAVAFGAEASSTPTPFAGGQPAAGTARAQAAAAKARPPAAPAHAAQEAVKPAAPAGTAGVTPAPTLGANRSPIIE